MFVMFVGVSTYIFWHFFGLGIISDVPEKEQEDVIFLHPQTLKLLGLYVGHFAVFQHMLVVRVWPDKSVNIASVGVGKKLWKDLRLQKNDYVVVHEHHHSHISALSVDIHVK